MDDPVEALYTALGGLATGGKRVQVAEEPDGSLYGPAVFRVHYAGHEYAPHINHEGEDDRSQTFLELRGLRFHTEWRCCAGVFHPQAVVEYDLAAQPEQATLDNPGFAAQHFGHQFAGLLCITHSDPSAAPSTGHDEIGRPQALIHNVRPSPETAAVIAQKETGADGRPTTGFDQWSRERGFERCQLSVEPGDFYL